MTLLLILAIALTIRLSLIMTTNPFGIGLLILFIALLIASFYASLISSWLAFLIFLIYIGGILVIFAYFLALTPNTPISFSSSSLISSLTLFLITLLYLPSLFTWRIPIKSSKLIESIFTLYNFSILISLTLILFLSIVVIVKISRSNKGPLRAFISYV